MFKYFKEMRELKRAKLQFQTALMGNLFSFVDGLPDIIDIAKKAKDLNINEIQNLIAVELVKYVKGKEEVSETEETETPTEV